MSDELKKIKNSSLNDHSKIATSASEEIDILWEYDGLLNAYRGECEEILLEMQRIFYEDLLDETTKKGRMLLTYKYEVRGGMSPTCQVI